MGDRSCGYGELCVYCGRKLICAMNFVRLTIFVLGLLAAVTAGGQEVRGFVCGAVVPEEGQMVFDFSRCGAVGEAVWDYRLKGDSAASVSRRGQGTAVREDHVLHGDTAWLVCRESRVWVSRDTVPTAVWRAASCEGAIRRKVRRFKSEHYVENGMWRFAPKGDCTLILAEGDTLDNAQMTYRHEEMSVWPADVAYAQSGDSLCAVVKKDIWNWGYGPQWPLLACTEVTETHNVRTGEVFTEEWTAVFPARANADAWGAEMPGKRHAGGTMSLNSTRGTVAPITRQGEAEGEAAMNPAGTPRIETAPGMITVECGAESAVQVTVTDISGRVMHECEVNGTVTLSTGGWPYGEYVIKAGDVVRKIILEP